MGEFIAIANAVIALIDAHEVKQKADREGVSDELLKARAELRRMLVAKANEPAPAPAKARRGKKKDT